MAGAKASRMAMGIWRSNSPRLTSPTVTRDTSLSMGVQIFPGFILLRGSNAALILRNSVYSSSPKNAGAYSLR